MAEEVLVDPEALRGEVRDKYRAVALKPDATYHVHTERPLARRLGYETDAVEALPDRAVVCTRADPAQAPGRTPNPRRSSRLAILATGPLSPPVLPLLMEITCAGCGCRVDHGVIVERGEKHPRCCCQDLSVRQAKQPYPAFCSSSVKTRYPRRRARLGAQHDR